MPTELIQDIWQICIIPILGVLTVFIVKYLQIKSDEILDQVNNATAKKYISLITETITNCVIATNQTYVDTLKKENRFDKEAQQKAFEKTLNAVLNILSEDAKMYIKETTGDLNTYLSQMIEAEVNKNKNK